MTALNPLDQPFVIVGASLSGAKAAETLRVEGFDGRLVMIGAEPERPYRERFADRRWLMLRDAGARPQRPLWASTGTKDPAYSDVLYVEALVAPGVVNTMPESTLRAFADHGDPTRDFREITAAGAETLERAERASADLAAITSELEREGVRSFCASYHELLDCIETKLRRAAPATSARS